MTQCFIILAKWAHHTFISIVKIRILLFLLLVIGAASVTQADPLTFRNVNALQNSGNTSVSLLSNSGATLTGSQLTFTIDIVGSLPAGGTDMLSITYHDSQGGNVVQQFSIPLFGTFNPPVTVFVTINIPTFSYVAIPATLSVDLLNSNPDFIHPATQMGFNSFTYHFNVVQPVPEPATLTLLLGGVATLWIRRQRTADK
jgi:hypothetical protein